ncbi:ead/Ea22-like family protein [Salmonella enterica]|nr:ead/Ea22-like family protein [Salmonella enterica]
MTALNKPALRQKAVKAGGEEWQSRKEPGIGGEYTVIVKGSLVKHQGWSTHRPVADEIVDKKTMDFIAAANPATVLALLDEQEAAEKRIAELEARKVTVKLPADYRNSDSSINDDMFNTCAVVGAFRDALAAAGIGVKGE